MIIFIKRTGSFVSVVSRHVRGLIDKRVLASMPLALWHWLHAQQNIHRSWCQVRKRRSRWQVRTRRLWCQVRTRRSWLQVRTRRLWWQVRTRRLWWQVRTRRSWWQVRTGEQNEPDVCVCAPLYVCALVCVCVCVCVCMCVCLRERESVCTYLCVLGGGAEEGERKSVYASVCMCECVCICVPVCVCERVRAYVRKCMCVREGRDQWLYCSLNSSAKDGVVILCVCLGTVQYWWISTGLVVVQLRAVFRPSVQYLSLFCEAFSWTILDYRPLLDNGLLEVEPFHKCWFYLVFAFHWSKKLQAAIILKYKWNSDVGGGTTAKWKEVIKLSPKY